MNTININQNFLNIIFLILFVSLVIFDLTVYKFIWGIEAIARIGNLVTLLFFTIFSLICIVTMKIYSKQWIFIIFPAFLMFISTFINVTRFAYQDTSIISFYGTLLPIVTLLSVPFLVKLKVLDTKKIFSYYYMTMLLIVSISLVEYLLIFSGFIVPSLINTSGGNFMAANFSILFDLEDNIYNETDFSLSFYASILESGSLAMLILPALIYAFFNKYYLGFLILFIALIATNSLGGFISLGIFALIYPYLETRIIANKFSTTKSFMIFIYIILIFISFSFIVGYLIDIYNSKFAIVGPSIGDSATSGSTRIDNIVILFSDLPSILIENPLGYALSADSNSIFMDGFYGFNVGLGISIYNGGFLSFIGYIMLTLTYVTASLRTLLRKNLQRESVIAAASLLVLFPFFVQRGSIFETSILILLTSPFVVEFLSQRKNINQLNGTRIT